MDIKLLFPHKTGYNNWLHSAALRLSRPSMASEALGLLPGGLFRSSLTFEALELLPIGGFINADCATTAQR